jgi:uncharacterized repeat protein (TIGR03803 family)
MKISFAVGGGAGALALALIATSSTPSEAGPAGPVRLGTQQVRPASSTFGSVIHLPPICRQPFVLPLAPQCAGPRARAAAAGRTASRPYVAAGVTESVLWSFTGGSDGVFPQGPVMVDRSGALYGVNAGCNIRAWCYDGVVYKLGPPASGQGAWTQTDIFGFPSTNGALGYAPSGGLVMDETGALFGTTTYGGDVSCNCGVVYKLTPPPRSQI